MVRQAAGYYQHVFFEGLRTSFTYGPWIALAEDLVTSQAPALPFVVLAMDTPYETCIARVHERNGGKPINEKPQRDNFRTLHGARLAAWRATSAATIEYLDHTRSVEDVIAWFATAGWSRGTQAA
jgi:thymidylate kinase